MIRLSILLSIITLFSCGKQEKKTKDIISESAPIKELTDDQLLDIVEKQTFAYFWDYAEPNSGLARERFHPDGNYPENDAHIVTTGGSGFGLMALVSGMSRGYVTKEKGVERLNKIADFLAKADRFHGAWPHWMDGNTGKVKPFGMKDNGGDLVETSFVCQALITIREYFKNGSTAEKELAAKADEL